jgi:hypothetical protein
MPPQHRMIACCDLYDWFQQIPFGVWTHYTILDWYADWMNMTPEINLAGCGSLPNPSEGHILPGISLQEVIEVNEWHHIHDRHYQIITLISYVYTISYTYIVYYIVFDIDDIAHDIAHDSLPDV